MLTAGFLAALGLMDRLSLVDLDTPSTEADLAEALARWRKAHGAWLDTVDAWRAAVAAEAVMFGEGVENVPALRTGQMTSDAGRAYGRTALKLEDAAGRMEMAARGCERARKVILRTVARLPEFT